MLRQSASVIDKFSPAKEKVKLYQSLFQGRSDVEHLFVLKGGMGKKQLKHIMEEINDSKIDSNIVILATGRYIGEGFDLKELDTLFLPFPISWKGTLAQYVGRLHRESVGKTEVRVYDYVDGNVPVLV